MPFSKNVTYRFKNDNTFSGYKICYSKPSEEKEEDGEDEDKENDDEKAAEGEDGEEGGEEYDGGEGEEQPPTEDEYPNLACLVFEVQLTDRIQTNLTNVMKFNILSTVMRTLMNTV